MKEKKPGDHIILRLKNSESPLILEWINSQSNLSDAIRYLIEEEIKAHSVRDLQEYIPAKRKPLATSIAEAAASVEDAAHMQPAAPPPNEVKADSEKSSQPSGEPQPFGAQSNDQGIVQPQGHETRHSPGRQRRGENESGASTYSEPDQKDQPSPGNPSLPQQEEREDEYSDEIIDHWMNI